MSKKAKVIPEESEFSINTGHIYSEIISQWHQYPRELFTEL